MVYKYYNIFQKFKKVSKISPRECLNFNSSNCFIAPEDFRDQGQPVLVGNFKNTENLN